ncbi:MAG: GntR family transcriptional regulator [Acidimicrobiaceae bacterium]|nr:GntR family transcriptional regulator [Acidimicrobiaceae bacterium]
MPDKQTKQARVYDAIRERILNGVYGPGYRVVIDVLAEEFEVSALPVREAIRRLEAEGLIVYRPNAGAQVAPADPALFVEQMAMLAVLEGYATSLAAPLLKKADIERLTAINRSMTEAMGRLDSLGFGRLNQEFHGYIVQRCENAALVSLLDDVGRRLDAIRRTVFLQIPYRGAASVAEHEALIRLLARRAPAVEIEMAAREHKLHTVHSFRDWQNEHRPERLATEGSRATSTRS